MELLELFKESVTTDKKPRIIVIGDVMDDCYVHCDVGGISPEDDLALKLRPTRQYHRAGGAANVALNLRSLGAEVVLISLTGADDSAWLVNHLREHRIQVFFHHTATRPTTTKTRYVTSRGRHAFRVDCEKTTPISADEAAILTMFLHDHKSWADLIVVSDYAKGVVTDDMLRAIRQTEVPFIVDPKHDDLMRYHGAIALTPNEKEFLSAMKADSLAGAFRAASAKLFSTMSVLVTRAGDGATFFFHVDADEWKQHDIPVRKREFGDPCGCGDSLIAGLAWAIASKWAPIPSCHFSVAVGACAIDHEGAYAVCPADVDKELQSFKYW